MKAISLWQPWASAIALGLKTYETRHWATNHRGPIAIHAARKETKELKQFFDSIMLTGDVYHPFHASGIFSFTMLPKGAIVAVAELETILSTDKVADRISDTEKKLGNYQPNRFAWRLTNIQPLPQPYYIKGRQGIFEVPDVRAAQ